MDRDEMIKTLSTDEMTTLNKLMVEYKKISDEFDSENREKLAKCFEQINKSLDYLYRISNQFIHEHPEEAMYHLGRMTSELKAFSEYYKPQEKDNGHC
jgi:hypothetical protein